MQNTGNSQELINKVTTLFFVDGTTWAPTTTDAICLLGAPNPMKLGAKGSMTCQFAFTMKKVGFDAYL